MKTQVSKPAQVHARYTPEYREEALAHWRKSGRSAAKVAEELGIRAPLLYRWARMQRESAAGGLPLSSAPASIEQLQERIRCLTEENAKLLEQREVLKKSLGILSETPPRSMPRSNA